MTRNYDFFSGRPTESEEPSEQLSYDEIIQHIYDGVMENIQTPLTSPAPIILDTLSTQSAPRTIVGAMASTAYRGISPTNMQMYHQFNGNVFQQQIRPADITQIQTGTIRATEVVHNEPRVQEAIRGATADYVYVDLNNDADGEEPANIYAEDFLRDYFNQQQKEAQERTERMKKQKRESIAFTPFDSLDGRHHAVKLVSVEGVYPRAIFYREMFYETEILRRFKKRMIPVLNRHIPHVMTLLSSSGILQSLQYRYNKSLFFYDQRIKAEVYNCCPICGEKMHHEHKKKNPIKRKYQDKSPWLSLKPQYFKTETVKEKMERIHAQEDEYLLSHCENINCRFHSISYKKGFHMSQLNQLDLYINFLSLIALKNVTFPHHYDLTMISVDSVNHVHFRDKNTKEDILEAIPLFQSDFISALPKEIQVPRSIM